MNGGLKLIDERKVILEQLETELQKRKAKKQETNEMTLQEEKLITTYGELMDLKLGLYYYNDEDSEKVTLLKEKYKHLNLRNINDQINGVLDKMNKEFIIKDIEP